MTSDPVIASILEEYEDFTLTGEEEETEPLDPLANHCPPARTFRLWCTEMLERYVRQKPDTLRLSQAKVLLVDRFFEFMSCAPKSHRDKTSGKGHVCLYQVFMETLTEIRMAQLSLSPPEVFVVPAKPASETPPVSLVQLKPAMFLGRVSG
jgi:hypothetical protein